MMPFSATKSGYLTLQGMIIKSATENSPSISAPLYGGVSCITIFFEISDGDIGLFLPVKEAVIFKVP